MKPPKHILKPAKKSGGARPTTLSDQMANNPADFAASQAAHFDNYSVEQFAYAMRIKLAVKRQEGRGGWQDKEYCSGEYLSSLLREHVEKGDPVDVANFCMMLHQRGERISPAPQMQDIHRCPICAEPFRMDDLCATDITEGICHADCLEGSPVVDLCTGEELSGGKVDIYPYSEVAEPSQSPRPTEQDP